MTERRRAVLDTNVFVAAFLSQNPNSPTRELLDRLRRDEFAVLVCDTLVNEIAEKLTDRQISPDRIARLLAFLQEAAEWVAMPSEAVARVLTDADDNVVLACAVLGRADYLVTYDPHFDALGGDYQGIKVVKALPFLWAVRGDRPPGGESAPPAPRSLPASSK